MTSGYLNHNHGRLYYEIIGSGEPVVFIHGFTLDHRMWRPQVEFLKDRYQTITYDARGFGASTVPAQAYSHHDDLRALLEKLGIASAHVAGLSMGGRIAVNFALTYPAMVRTLTLMDAALDGHPDTVNWNVGAKEQGLERAKENWLNHEIFAGSRESARAMAALRQAVTDYSGWHWLHRDGPRPAETDARAKLSQITAPTLVMVGEKDLDYYRQIADILVANIPQTQGASVRGAGHMTNLEQPDTTNRLLVQNFLRHAHGG